MHVTIIGAAGRTGSLVVKAALAAGHTVTAFVHDSSQAAPAESGVKIAQGDSTDLSAVSAALRSTNAVIDCIGGTTPYKHTELEQSTAATILQAIREQAMVGTPQVRLVAISMMGVGDSRQQAPFWYEHLLMPTFLHGATPDKTAMETEVRSSGVPYVLVRPPLLTDYPATGTVKVLPPEETGHKITRADLAHFIVQQLTSDTYLNQAVTVVNS